MVKKITCLALTLQIVAALSCSSSPEKNPEVVKNIVLIIGDGMGIPQVYAGIATSPRKLNFERATYTGFAKTYSASDFTTDSGAGATAIATGTKTTNKSIAVDENNHPLKTITDYVREAGKSTGIVATCELVHATPASFAVHNSSRYNYAELAESFANCSVDVLIGGGAKLFDSVGTVKKLAAAGYDTNNNINDIDTKSLKPVISLPFTEHAPSITNGRDLNYLRSATQLAMDKLSNNPNGFFLMVEGSQVDWGGHDNDVDYIVNEVHDLDRAIGAAFDFADNNPGTLVIITADHETGGLSLKDGNTKNNTVMANFSTTNHTGNMVPVFAYGAGAQVFTGIMENTDIFLKMMAALGFD